MNWSRDLHGPWPQIMKLSLTTNKGDQLIFVDFSFQAQLISQVEYKV